METGTEPCTPQITLDQLPAFVSLVSGLFSINQTMWLTTHGGSRVAVICTIPAGRGDQSVAQFSLDGHGRFYLVSHPTSREVRRRIVFWDSGPLPFGQHVLTIMNMGREAEFRLNRIDFDPTDGNAAQAPNPPSQQRLVLDISY